MAAAVLCGHHLLPIEHEHTNASPPRVTRSNARFPVSPPHTNPLRRCPFLGDKHVKRVAHALHRPVFVPKPAWGEVGQVLARGQHAAAWSRMTKEFNHSVHIQESTVKRVSTKLCVHVCEGHH